MNRELFACCGLFSHDNSATRANNKSTMTAEPASSLHFHENHGANIKISLDSTIARRIDTNFFKKGLAFSSRPIETRERIYIKLSEVSDNLGAFIYVGFTSKDPSNLRNCNYSDLTSKPGYWTWFFPKHLCAANVVLFYYYTQSGEVRFGVGGEENGKFEHKISLDGPVWACANIFGNLNSIKILDCTLIQQLEQKEKLNPLPLHKVFAKNAVITQKNRVSRKQNSQDFGCVFSSRPLSDEEVLAVKILRVNPRVGDCLSLGLTSCDPESLTVAEIPANSDSFLDRPEYWVQISDFSGGGLKRGDEVSFSFKQNGEVSLFLNGNLIRVSHVDGSLNLWAFFDVCGSTEEISVWTSENTTRKTDNDKECMVCYENSIDTALYRCGHMCMCFECALEQWQGKGDGHCPLCRAVIKDVIRTLE